MGGWTSFVSSLLFLHGILSAPQNRKDSNQDLVKASVFLLLEENIWRQRSHHLFFIIDFSKQVKCKEFEEAGFHCVPKLHCDKDGIINKTDPAGTFDPVIQCVLNYIINNTNTNVNVAGLQTPAMTTLKESVVLLREAEHWAPPVQLLSTSAASTPTAPRNTQAVIWNISPAGPTVVPELRTMVQIMRREQRQRRQRSRQQQQQQQQQQ